jgi:TPR repeat protein
MPVGADASDDEIDSHVMKGYMARAEKNDPQAIWQLALSYKSGSGVLVPVNEKKALELTKRAADLGNTEAQYSLGLSYERGDLGLEVDKEKGRNLLESAAKGGNVKARFTLGRDELSKGNIIDSVRHWHIAAASGFEHAMVALIIFFEGGELRHKDLARSLRASDKACLDIRSDSRDRYLTSPVHLEFIGQNV